jgi:hypothetical protein
MDDSNQEQKSEIPQYILNQLGEHTVGGYAIFYFSPETGYPTHQLIFDSPAHCLSMQKYMTDWCNALQAVYIEGAKAHIRSTLLDEEEEE